MQRRFFHHKDDAKHDEPAQQHHRNQNTLVLRSTAFASSASIASCCKVHTSAVVSVAYACSNLDEACRIHCTCVLVTWPYIYLHSFTQLLPLASGQPLKFDWGSRSKERQWGCVHFFTTFPPSFPNN